MIEGCRPSCERTCRVVAHRQDELGSIVVCITCGGAHTKNHGLSADEIAVVVAIARRFVAEQASSRLTTRKTRKGSDHGAS